VPLELVAAAPTDDALTISTLGGEQRFAAPRDVLLDLETARTLEAFEGRVSFLDTAQLQGPLESLPPLSGRVAVVDGVVTDRPGAGERLRARGARGLLQLVDSATFADRQAAWSGRVQVLLAHNVPTSRRTMLPVLMAGPAVATAMRVARGRDPAPRLRVHPAVRLGPFTSTNVACRLAGAGAAADTEHYVAFAAHYDHLGVQYTLEADSIYNGFSDNAAGVAMVLGIADVLKRRPLRASAVFLFFAAEELGLLGSDEFVETPPIPLSQIRVLINLDAGAPPGALRSWRVATSDGRLAELSLQVGAQRGWSISISPARPNSDHFGFARHGVPSALLVPGPGPYDGLTPTASDSLRAKWERYHQPGDEWSAEFPWVGLQRYAEVALELARAADSAFDGGSSRRLRPPPGAGPSDTRGSIPSDKRLPIRP